MAVDLTPAFNVILYAIFLESLLFFAVIMQTKSVEPGAHSGVARYFGLMFLFQAFSTLFTALCEQFYPGIFSYYFAVISIAMTLLAVAVTIPAAIAVAVPESNRPYLFGASYLLSIVAIVLAAFKLAPILVAQPDVPYIDGTLQREVLLAFVAAMGILALASVVRMIRRMRGRNGAFILLAALALVIAFGGLWAWLEPLCRMVDPKKQQPEQHLEQPQPQLQPDQNSNNNSNSNLLIQHSVLSPPSSSSSSSTITTSTSRQYPQLSNSSASLTTSTSISTSTSTSISSHSAFARASTQWPDSCPLPKSFDHNFFLGLVILAANVLAAEGVLRLMAAGSGVEGYVEIIPVIQT